MKKQLLLVLFTAFLGLAQAEDYEFMAPKPRDYTSLITGDWEAKAGNLAAHVIINPTGTFSGVLGENGKVVWVYSGTWRLDGKELTWHYDDSLQALPEYLKNKVDKNTILSLDEEDLVLQELDGKVTKYRRKQ